MTNLRILHIFCNDFGILYNPVDGFIEFTRDFNDYFDFSHQHKTKMLAIQNIE